MIIHESQLLLLNQNGESDYLSLCTEGSFAYKAIKIKRVYHIQYDEYGSLVLRCPSRISFSICIDYNVLVERRNNGNLFGYTFMRRALNGKKINWIIVDNLLIPYQTL